MHSPNQIRVYKIKLIQSKSTFLSFISNLLFESVIIVILTPKLNQTFLFFFQNWKGNVCFNFLLDVLQFLKESILEDSLTKVILYLKQGLKFSIRT